MKKPITILFFCWVGLQAEGIQPRIARTLSRSPVVSGKFVQVKKINGLDKPLNSRGDFLVSTNRGVLWRTQHPFHSVIAITRSGIGSLKSTGGLIHRQSVHQGNLGEAMNLIQKILSGETAPLEKNFTVLESGDSTAWTLDLRPLDSVMARFMKAIQIQGGSHVNRIEFQEVNGDKTSIDFTEVVDEPGDLNSWQAAAFRD